MKIGINASHRLHGGVLTSLRHMLRTWSDEGIDRKYEIVLFVRDNSIEQLADVVSPAMRIVPVGVGGNAIPTPFPTLRKLFWEQFQFGGILKREGVDVLLCAGNIIPLFARTRTVLAVHNAGPFCDSMTIRNVGFSLWLWMKVLGILTAISARRATRVIFLSAYLKNILQKRYTIGPSEVIFNGRDTMDASSEVRLPAFDGRYLLFVGNLYRYKNVEQMIEGYASDRYFADQEIRLVIVGNALDPGYYRELHDVVRRHNLEEMVIFTGWQPQAEINALMKKCEVLVFQTTCENCPNVLIEAFSAGLAIACSNASVMPEMAGDAVAYYDPFDPKSIAMAIRRILDDGAYAAELRARAEKQALKFPTWREVSRATLRALESAAAE